MIFMIIQKVKKSQSIYEEYQIQMAHGFSTPVFSMLDGRNNKTKRTKE